MFVQTRWADALRRLLAERPEWTQQRLADASGVDKNTITNLLRGSPTKTDTLEKLAKCLEIDIAEFFVTPAQADLIRRSNTAHAELLQSSDAMQRLTQAVLERLAPAVAVAVQTTLSDPAIVEAPRRKETSPQRVKPAPLRRLR